MQHSLTWIANQPIAQDALAWTLNQYVLLGLLLALFGFVGYRRGVNRELVSMLGVGIGIMLAGRVAPSLRPQVNLMYRLMQVALAVFLRSQDFGAAWNVAQAKPDLIGAESLKMMELLVFCLIVLVFYGIGQRFFRDPGGPMLRILGFISGGLNGFLIAYYLFPLVFTQPTAVITVPSGEISKTLVDTDNLAMAVVFFIVVLIAFGLYSAKGAGKRK